MNDDSDTGTSRDAIIDCMAEGSAAWQIVIEVQVSVHEFHQNAMMRKKTFASEASLSIWLDRVCDEAQHWTMKSVGSTVQGSSRGD